MNHTHIVYTPPLMNADQLTIEMILSSLMSPYAGAEAHTITATDGAMLYHYRNDENGLTLTSRVISLCKPHRKLKILSMSKGMRIDKKRVADFLDYLELPSSDQPVIVTQYTTGSHHEVIAMR